MSRIGRTVKKVQDKTLLIRALGESPTMKIIDFFLDNRSDYSKKEIIEHTGMPKTTLYKIWKELERFGIVIVTRKYGKAKLFKLNGNNDIVKNLMALDFILGKYAMNKIICKGPVIVNKTPETATTIY